MSLTKQNRSVTLCTAQQNKLQRNIPQKAAQLVKKVQDLGPKLTQFGYVLGAAAFLSGGANALTYDDFQGLSYTQIKGSGLANTCPIMKAGSSDVNVKPGKYQMSDFCFEPTSFTVKEESDKGEPEFVKTKLMTRLTYTLTGISGNMEIGGGGSVKVTEEDGIDFAPVTVQLAGGERVAFLFSVKQLAAEGTLDQFGGTFNVPSYRGSSFLDPKGRGGSTGYDTAVGLPSSGDDDEYAKENNKSYKTYQGQAILSAAKYDAGTGEIAGVFESIQSSDTDQGTKVPKDVKIQGIWYGRLN